MQSRRMLLRGILVSLSLAAGLGVLAVLKKSGDVLTQLLWSAGLAAVALGLLIPLTGVSEQGRSRAAAQAALWTVILLFVDSLLLVWEVDEFFGAHAEEELVITMGIVLLGGLATAIFLWTGTSERHRAAAVVGLATTVVTCGVWLAVCWIDPGYPVNDHVWESGVAVGLTGLLLCAVLLNAGRWPRQVHRLAALASGLTMLYLWLFMIWGSRYGAGVNIIFAGLVGFVALVGHQQLLKLASLRPRDEWMRRFARWGAMTTALLGVGAVVCHEIGVWSVHVESLTRIAGAGGMLTACASLAVGVQARLTRSVTAPVSPALLAEMNVTCPRCGKKQALPVGGAGCGGCGLRIEIRLVEPRCPQCDYELFGTALSRCPECGTALTPAG